MSITTGVDVTTYETRQRNQHRRSGITPSKYWTKIIIQNFTRSNEVSRRTLKPSKYYLKNTFKKELYTLWMSFW